MSGSTEIILSSALSLEESNKLKSKNAHCTQEMGQERCLWADTPGKLNLGGDLRRGRGWEDSGRRPGSEKLGQRCRQENELGLFT